MRLLRSHSIYKKCVDTYALMAVANMFANGNIVPQNLPEAKKIFSALAKENIPQAKESLAAVDKMIAEQAKSPAKAAKKS